MKRRSVFAHNVVPVSVVLNSNKDETITMC